MAVSKAIHFTIKSKRFLVFHKFIVEPIPPQDSYLFSINTTVQLIKYPAASNGVSSLQRCRAAGYLTLAAVAKCLRAATWLVAHGN